MGGISSPPRRGLLRVVGGGVTGDGGGTIGAFARGAAGGMDDATAGGGTIAGAGAGVGAAAGRFRPQPRRGGVVSAGFAAVAGVGGADEAPG